MIRNAGVAVIAIALAMSSLLEGQTTAFKPIVPKAWDDNDLATMDLPVPGLREHAYLSSAEYYKLPVRPIPKGYPVFAPSKEPAGYLGTLRTYGPQTVQTDPASLRTEEDWIRWGESLFQAPLARGDNPTLLRDLHDPGWYQATGTHVSSDGVVPNFSYVVESDGHVAVRASTCMQCHARVFDDGRVILGAQGNQPADRVRGFQLRREIEQGISTGAAQLETAIRASTVPWQKPDPAERFRTMTPAQLAEAVFDTPPGVAERMHTSRLFPPKTPDLIGVKERRYLDATGAIQHRSVGDLMRYIALVEGQDQLETFDDAGPFGPRPLFRYSDEQLYAMALFVYSLKPPPNPNVATEESRRGETIFRREGCVACHTPPLYTSNALTPAVGFDIPEDHRKRFTIIARSVGTDARLALHSRKGTGYYRVPSLKGVWYRGPFEHNGSVATLEDWFDSARLREDYRPTGFRGLNVTVRPVRGHEFGLGLSGADKAALLAFLRTL